MSIYIAQVHARFASEKVEFKANYCRSVLSTLYNDDDDEEACLFKVSQLKSFHMTA